MKEKHHFHTPGHYSVHHVTSLGKSYAPLADENISCIMSSVCDMIQGRKFEPKESVCMISSSQAVVVLNRNPSDTVFTTTITGKVSLSWELNAMRVNGAGWVARDLANLFRLNPHLLAPHERNNVYQVLRQYVVTKTKAEEGDTRGNQSKSVRTESTLPAHIDLMVPVLTGEEPEVVRVEIDLLPNDDLLYLVSSDLNRRVSEAIATQQKVIAELCEQEGIPVVTT